MSGNTSDNPAQHFTEASRGERERDRDPTSTGNLECESPPSHAQGGQLQSCGGAHPVQRSGVAASQIHPRVDALQVGGVL